MRDKQELNCCELCEENKATYKYTFSSKSRIISMNICDKCAGYLMSVSNDKLGKYRNLERLAPPKTYTKTR